MFENARSVSSLINQVPGCHVETSWGSPQQCIDYCLKQDSIDEWGLRPRGTHTIRPGTSVSTRSDTDCSVSTLVPVSRRSGWDDDDDDEVTPFDSVSHTSASTQQRKGTAQRLRVLELLKDNNYEPLAVYKTDPILYGNHHLFIERICKAEKQLAHDQTPRAWKTRVVVCTGPPGSGKTRYAQRRMKGLGGAIYNKDTSEWWPEYRQQPIVFLDEYNDWFSWDQLLRLMSQLPETVPVKNSQAVYNARHLFITTHRSPDTWYKGSSGFNVSALLDRIDEWRVFEKTVDGQYYNTLQTAYRDTTRLFETMAQIEPLLEDDDDTVPTASVVPAPAPARKRPFFETLDAYDALMPERVAARRSLHDE